jgi:predicted MFS family arabinose efflux permease
VRRRGRFGRALRPSRANRYSRRASRNSRRKISPIGDFGSASHLDVARYLVRGSTSYGRHPNYGRSSIGTVQGVGASSSGLPAGIIVDHLGYNAASMTAAGVAILAFAVLAMEMPDTAPRPHVLES